MVANSETKILVIGAGGIGSNFVDLVARSIATEPVADEYEADVESLERVMRNHRRDASRAWNQSGFCERLSRRVAASRAWDEEKEWGYSREDQIRDAFKLLLQLPYREDIGESGVWDTKFSVSFEFLQEVVEDLGERAEFVEYNYIRVTGSSGTIYRIIIDPCRSSDWYTVYCEINNRLKPICIQTVHNNQHEPIPFGDVLVNLVLALYNDRDSARHIDTLIPHLGRTSSSENVSITVMDGDIVESRNLRHQRYLKEDVGEYKAQALANRLDENILRNCSNLSIHPINEYFTERTDINHFDLVVVAVDCEEPRQLVHENAKCWLDLRATGDGFVMWSHMDDLDVLNLFPKLQPGESASCQHENAVETGHIQFGFALAAAHGAQWTIQWLRNSLVPPCRTYTIHMGELPLPTVDEVVAE